MKTAVAVVVHSAEHVRRALDAAAGSPLLLISTYDGAAVIGARAFASMIAEGMARANAPEPDAWLDCGDLPGHALGALRDGCPRILFDGPTDALRDLARQRDARIEPRPAEAFDLGRTGTDDAALAAYLKEGITECPTH